MSDGPGIPNPGGGPAPQQDQPTATRGWSPPGQPDWAALADRHQAEGRRRRRLMMIGGGVLGTTVVGALVATAVLVSGYGTEEGETVVATTESASTQTSHAAASSTTSAVKSPSASPSGSESGSPSPSPSASAAPSPAKQSAAPSTAPASAPAPTTRAATPRDPLTMISDLTTDTAPLDPAVLFPARTLSVDGRTWTRGRTAAIAPCWKATTGGLGDVMEVSACRSLLRATYVSGGSAVTVGAAVFDRTAQAALVEQHHKGQIQGLTDDGTISFCTSAGCANTHGTVGRYGYFTVSGSVEAGGTTADPVATAAGPDLAAYAYQRLLQRGKDAAAD